MSRTIRITLAVCIGVALVTALGVTLTIRASHHVPEFYQQAVASQPRVERAASDELLENVSALTSSVRDSGQWHALFTQQQINGWLAVELIENHQAQIPPEFSDPRVLIQSDGATLAVRYDNSLINSVLSLQIDLYMAETNLVALRIRRVRAGLLPLPLDGILREIGNSAQTAGVRLRWRQTEGDPVALIEISEETDDPMLRRVVDAIELRDGEVYLSGRTLPRDEQQAAAGQQAVR